MPHEVELDEPAEDCEDEWNAFFNEVVLSALLFYGREIPPHLDTKQAQFRLALAESWKSAVEDEIRDVKRVTRQPPFSDIESPKDAINYHAALEEHASSTIATRIAKDMMPWAWNRLADTQDADTLFYLGLIIVRLYFSVRNYNCFKPNEDKIVPWDKAALDKQNLVHWQECIQAALRDPSSGDNPFTNLSQYALPHVAVFSWLCWEYLDDFRS